MRLSLASTVVLGLFFSTLNSSCATYKKAFNIMKVQEKLADYASKEPYKMSLGQAKQKIEGFFNRSIMDAQPIAITSPGFKDRETMDRIDKLMNDGFFYKDKFYTSVWALDQIGAEFKNASGRMFKGKYHFVEETENGFMAVKGSTVVEATKVSDQLTKIKISRLTNTVRPMAISFDIWGAAQGKDLKGEVVKRSPDLDKSRKYLVLDRGQIIDFYYFADKAAASKKEEEIRSQF